MDNDPLEGRASQQLIDEFLGAEELEIIGLHQSSSLVEGGEVPLHPCAGLVACGMDR
jgi:hypothetical protein